MKSLCYVFFIQLVVSCFAADRYESLRVGSENFRDVLVLSASESALTLRHSRGVAQVALAKLPLELQGKYGYSLDLAVRRGAELAVLREQHIVNENKRLAVAKAKQTKAAGGGAEAKNAFASFGSQPELRAEVDLRSLFRRHGIRIRKQFGPSCSVHAVLAALEYQFAESQGQVLNLSERHLVQATCRSLGRPDFVGFDTETGQRKGWDMGFTLEEVFQAMRGNGLALEQSSQERAAERPILMMEDVTFSAFVIPGIGSGQGIENIVHVLNADMPVVVGVAWPEYFRIARTSVLSSQAAEPGAGHAVTIIGYRCEDGKLENIKFIFRNSWGDSWGAGGYGFFTYDYLVKNLRSCYVVELR